MDDLNVGRQNESIWRYGGLLEQHVIDYCSASVSSFFCFGQLLIQLFPSLSFFTQHSLVRFLWTFFCQSTSCLFYVLTVLGITSVLHECGPVRSPRYPGLIFHWSTSTSLDAGLMIVIDSVSSMEIQRPAFCAWLLIWLISLAAVVPADSQWDQKRLCAEARQ